MNNIVANRPYGRFEIFLLILLFMPLPLGLDRTGINILVCSFAAIGTAKYSINFNKASLVEFVVFLLYAISLTYIVGVTDDGSRFSPYQALRQTVFGVVAFIVFNWSSRSRAFYSALDRHLPLVLGSLLVQIPLFFMFPSLVNSAVGANDVTIDQDTRLYIYPFGLILILIPAVQRFRPIAFWLCALLTVVSGSKQVAVFLLISVLIYIIDKKNLRAILASIAAIFAMLLAAYFIGLGDRISTFLREGDMIREGEIAAAMARITTISDYIFGIGFGTAYWGGWAVSLRGLSDEDAWVLNSQYEVHNGYLSFFLRLGLVGVFWLIITAVRVFKGFPRRLTWHFIIYALLSLSSSISLFYLDLVYLAIVIGYCRYRLEEKDNVLGVHGLVIHDAG